MISINNEDVCVERTRLKIYVSYIARNNIMEQQV